MSQRAVLRIVPSVVVLVASVCAQAGAAAEFAIRPGVAPGSEGWTRRGQPTDGWIERYAGWPTTLGFMKATKMSDVTNPQPEQELLTLSKDKWRWMSERKVDSLGALFHDKAVFVHMGATMTKAQELETIRGGGIQYKNAEILEASVRFVGDTAILLNRIRLVAIVGGNEVTNPFVVTEVYVKVDGAWKLASLSFTRTMG